MRIGLMAAVAVAFFALQAEAGIKVVSMDRRQDAILACRPAGQLRPLDTYQMYVGGNWGDNLVYGQSFYGSPLSFSNSHGSVSATIDTTLGQTGDVIWGATSYFDTLFVRAKSSLAATSATIAGCPSGTFHTTASSTTVVFQTNSLEYMKFVGSMATSTTFAPLVGVTASLTCNGSGVFSVGAGSHDFEFQLGASQTCTYVVTAFANAEGSFGDVSSAEYNVYLSND